MALLLLLFWLLILVYVGCSSSASTQPQPMLHTLARCSTIVPVPPPAPAPRPSPLSAARRCTAEFCHRSGVNDFVNATRPPCTKASTSTRSTRILNDSAVSFARTANGAEAAAPFCGLVAFKQYGEAAMHGAAPTANILAIPERGLGPPRCGVSVSATVRPALFQPHGKVKRTPGPSG